jgi:hypothetical protein
MRTNVEHAQGSVKPSPMVDQPFAPLQPQRFRAAFELLGPSPDRTAVR